MVVIDRFHCIFWKWQGNLHRRFESLWHKYIFNLSYSSKLICCTWLKLSYSWKTQIRYISNIWPIFTELGVLCIRVHHLYIFHIDYNICYKNNNNSMMKTTSIMMTNSTNNEWCDYLDISIIPSVLQYLHTGIKICVIAAAVFVNDGIPNNYDDHFQFSWFDLDSNYKHNRYRLRQYCSSHCFHVIIIVIVIITLQFILLLLCMVSTATTIPKTMFVWCWQCCRCCCCWRWWRRWWGFWWKWWWYSLATVGLGELENCMLPFITALHDPLGRVNKKSRVFLHQSFSDL